MRTRYCYPLLLLLLVTGSIAAQTKLHAVYAGIEFRQTINGTETFYQSYYFRPDGSYCHELNNPGWKTLVNGHYTMNGKKITLVPVKSGSTNEMELVNDDIIRDNATSLFKYQVMNQLPAQTFVQVSDDGQTAIRFDGRGHFVQSGYRGASMLNKNNDFDGEGTCSIKESELVLQFSNGKVATKSFFYSGGKTATALINGSTYNATTSGNIYPPAKTDATDAAKIAPVTGGSIVTKGMNMLQKAHLAHGGKMLDSLNTIRLQATIGSISVIQSIDLKTQQLRMEWFNNQTLYQVEQLDNNTGWQWTNGKISPLPAEHIKELQAVFVTGILGLRSQNIKNITVRAAETNAMAGTETLQVTIGEKNYTWTFDAGHHLVAEALTTGTVQRSSKLKDLRMIYGITVPFTTVETSNEQSFTVNYTAVNINPVISVSQWRQPK